METTLPWREERDEISVSNLSYTEQNNLVETRYVERLTALSNVKDSLLHRAKLLAIEAGIEPHIFIKDVCNSICEETYYGKFDIEIQAGLKDAAKWLMLVDEKIKEQKKTIQQGEEYDIPSFKEYFFAFDNDEVHEMVHKEQDERSFEIINSFKNYNSEKMVDFLKENKCHLFREIENEGLVFSSFITDLLYHPAINFLMITPEDWNSNLTLGEEFVQTFIDCIRGGEFPSEEKIKQSSLGQLLYQQGYTFADLVQFETDSSSDNKVVFTEKSLFLDSLRSKLFEMNNSNSTGGVLTLCGTMDVDNLYKVLKNPDSQLVFDEQTTLGIFDPQRGHGSCFDIFLENLAVLPVRDCTFLIEEAGVVPHFFHTVNEVYDIPDIDWENEVFTRIPKLPTETSEKIIKKQPKMK